MPCLRLARWFSTIKLGIHMQIFLYNIRLCQGVADFIGFQYFSRFPTGLKSHVFISHYYLSKSKFDPLPRVLKASIKTPKEILFCKQTGLHILRKVRISCKGPLSTALYVYCYIENQFHVFQTAPMFFYILTSLLSTSQHRCL